VSLLEGVRARQPGLVEEVIPQLLSISDVQRVLQNLLSEGVSIAAIDLIVEYLADASRSEKNLGALTELVRQRHAYAICHKLRDRHRDLAVMSLDPRLENQIQGSLAAGGKRETLALDPHLVERLVRQISLLANEMIRKGREPVLLCGSEIRRQMRSLTRRSIPKLAVLSVNEIPLSVDLSSHGVVKLEADETPAVRPFRAADNTLVMEARNV
jgi:flagellar biosynthesis protein FlhA